MSAHDGKVYLGFDRGLLVGVVPPGGGAPVFVLAPNTPHEQVNGILAESDEASGSVAGANSASSTTAVCRSSIRITACRRSDGARCCAIAPETCGCVDRSISMSCHAENRVSGPATATCRNPVTRALSLAEDRRGRIAGRDRPGPRTADRRPVGIDGYRPGAPIGDRDRHPGRPRRVDLAWPLGQRRGAMARAR